MPKIWVVIPTYNEADNLPLLAAEIWAMNIPDLGILVVDDNSPDGTGAIADELAAKRPGDFYVIHREQRRGLGAAYASGFDWALKQGALVVIQMDCDFSHSPEHIPQMLYEFRDCDVVVGSRYVGGGQIDERWETARYLLSWWANAVYTRFVLNLNVKDATSGYKCWRADVLRSIDYHHTNTSGYSFQIEMAYLAQKLGFQAKEIPIYFEDRRIGRSRLNIVAKLEAVIRTWQILVRHRHVTPEDRLHHQPHPLSDQDREYSAIP